MWGRIRNCFRFRFQWILSHEPLHLCIISRDQRQPLLRASTTPWHGYPHFITLTHGSEIKKSKKSHQQVKNGSQKSSEREEFWAIVLHNTTFTISHSPHNRPCVCDRAALQGWWWAATCAASSSPRALPLHRRCFGALTSLALVANAASVAVPCSRCTTHRGGALLLPSAPDLAWG